MTPSIRTFLLINLLLSVTLITSLAIIGNLFLEHRVLQRHLDTQLTLMSLTIQAFVRDKLTPYSLADIQYDVNAIPDTSKDLPGVDKGQLIHEKINMLQFQIWDKHGKIILHSAKASKRHLSNGKPGYSNKWIDDQPWRVFTTKIAHKNITIAVAERFEFREEVENRITENSVFIMLITYPFLALLIWIIVGRGLDSLKKVTKDVGQSKPGHLRKVNTELVPTEIRPLVDELNDLFQRLRAAFFREKRFAADAAHELRTPLAALKTQTQVVLNIDDEEKRKAALQKLIGSVDRATHVVEQLLTLSRTAQQQIMSEFEKVDLTKQAKEIVALLVPNALEKNTEIELMAPKHAVYINGNSATIGILIRNLIQNAINYTPRNSLVKVIIEQKGKQVLLKVIDNGPGIPEELRERVFERFYRVVGSDASGTGLGLGIVQQIVEIHQAKLELSAPDEGTGLVVTVIFET